MKKDNKTSVRNKSKAVGQINPQYASAQNIEIEYHG